MNDCVPIKTVIIDDNKEYLASLRDHLALFPEIELQGFASHYSKAISLITKTAPDLVFLDIEMPGKNGFELLEEARNIPKSNFGVIFYTAYDQYVVNALRESAFDYILKPLKPAELYNSIQRFKTSGKIFSDLPSRQLPLFKTSTNEVISLPTNTGLKFVNMSEVVLFHCIKEFSGEKPSWKVMLTDQSQVKLRVGTTAKEVLAFVGKNDFVQISQSSIVNIRYLCAIEYKTRDCQLMPPYNNYRLTASRTHLSDLKQKYDLL